MAQPQAAHEQQGEYRASQWSRPVVTGELETREASLESRVEADAPEVAAEELAAGIGRQGLAGELDPQIAVDAEAKEAFCLSHWRWVSFLRSGCLLTTEEAEREPTSNADRFSASAFG